MGIKGIRAVKVKRGGGKKGRGREKIPTVNENPKRQTSQTMYSFKNK
jgi:hypothetical protein